MNKLINKLKNYFLNVFFKKRVLIKCYTDEVEKVMNQEIINTLYSLPISENNEIYKKENLNYRYVKAKYIK